MLTIAGTFLREPTGADGVDAFLSLNGDKLPSLYGRERGGVGLWKRGQVYHWSTTLTISAPPK
jgi:hypothetical protein